MKFLPTISYLLAIFSNLAIIACHSRLTYPPGGYPYPEHVADKDTDCYYFAIRNKLSRQDSFRGAMEYEAYQALDEPNLSLRPMPTDVFRFTYGTALSRNITLISLTPNDITIKWGTPTAENYSLPDTGRLTPLERRLVKLLDRNYPLDDTSRHHSQQKRQYLDSMGRIYPQLYDPTYYLALEAKEYKHSRPLYNYKSKKISITSSIFDHLVSGFNAAGYWRAPLDVACSEVPFDGDGFTLEANTALQYNFVRGSSCSDADSGHFKHACLELIRYAGLKNLIWDKTAHTDTLKKPFIIDDVQLQDVKEEHSEHKKHKKHYPTPVKKLPPN